MRIIIEVHQGDEREARTWASAVSHGRWVRNEWGEPAFPVDRVLIEEEA